MLKQMFKMFIVPFVLKSIQFGIFLSVLAAEIIKHYFPRIVEIHNYTPANAVKQKMDNWYLLNRYVVMLIGGFYHESGIL